MKLSSRHEKQEESDKTEFLWPLLITVLVAFTLVDVVMRIHTHVEPRTTAYFRGITISPTPEWKEKIETIVVTAQ